MSRSGLPILFQDNRFIVVDKPAGLPVHPGPHGGPSVEDGFRDMSRRKDGPWLAHRLDADTSGCLVIALRKSALVAAQAEFAAGRVEKIYWAVVRGAPAADAGRIDAPVLRQSRIGGWRMHLNDSGVPALTDWRVLGRGPGMAWIEFRPRTGRTHQIRVHAASIGCPLLGDPVYDENSQASGGHGRLHLLARSIRLGLEPPVLAEAQPGAHMRVALTACGWVSLV